MAHTNDIPAEKTLFDAANQLRGSVEWAEYKHRMVYERWPEVDGPAWV